MSLSYCVFCGLSICFVFFLMIRRPPRSTRTDTLFPYTTLFRSHRRLAEVGVQPRLAGLEHVSDAGRRRSRRVPFIAPFGIYAGDPADRRSEEHTSELQSLMRISYAVFCLKKKNKNNQHTKNNATMTQPQTYTTTTSYNKNI